MRTEQLIQAMAADTERSRPVGVVLPAALLGIATVVAAGFLWFAGWRPDLAEVIMQARVLVKQAFPILLAVGALGAALRLARPGETLGLWALVLAAVPILLALSVLAEFVALPAADWGKALIGHSIFQCLPLILLMSAPVLAGSLWALRRGASTRPALTGALAGVLSGATAAAVYAVSCTEDSSLFYAVWYVLAILAVTGLGALIGGRVLRW